MKIKYRSLKGYKYQLTERYIVDVNLFDFDIETQFIVLKTNGQMLIGAHYAWDGPSGPTIDTKNFMRGSLVHDAFYQLMREGHLSCEYRWHADRILREFCIEDGMSKLRAWYVYKSVRWFAGACAKPKGGKKENDSGR